MEVNSIKPLLYVCMHYFSYYDLSKPESRQGGVNFWICLAKFVFAFARKIAGVATSGADRSQCAV